MISIILPVFNGEKYIYEQLNSIIQQSYKDFEIIIIDDCSTDDSIQIAINLFDKRGFDRYKIIKNTKNLGVNKSLEIGINHAKGSFVAFSDQDDIWLTEKLEMLKTELGKNNRDLVYSPSFLMFDKKRTNRIFPKQKNISKLFNRLQLNNIRGATILTKKTFLLNIIPFSEYDIYDKWIYFHTILLDCAYLLTIPLDYYRIHDTNVVGNSFNFKNKNAVINSIKKKILFYKDLKRSFDKFENSNRKILDAVDEIIYFFSHFHNILDSSNIIQKINFYSKSILVKPFPLKEKFIYAYYIFLKR